MTNRPPETQVMLLIAKNDPEMGCASSDPTQQPVN
jgi:hypothetical protein